MSKKELLPFINNEALYRETKKVIDIAMNATAETESRLYSNVIDPFSALFDASCQGITLSDWIKQEKSRQAQKTFQNSLGDFHQEILGSMPGWKSLGKGKVIDLVNTRKRIIAEVKNKYNTMKGNSKVGIYDDLEGQLNRKYKGYTSYYVEIIPRNRRRYDKPFTPPDNRTHTRRPSNENIRVIDGNSFYAMAAGADNALKNIYQVLPHVIGDLTGNPCIKILSDNFYKELFDKAY
jgi:hypothetical protein